MVGRRDEDPHGLVGLPSDHPAAAESFHLMFERYRRRFTEHLARAERDPQLQEDIAHEAFARAVRQWQKDAEESGADVRQLHRTPKTWEQARGSLKGTAPTILLGTSPRTLDRAFARLMSDDEPQPASPFQTYARLAGLLVGAVAFTAGLVATVYAYGFDAVTVVGQFVAAAVGLSGATLAVVALKTTAKHPSGKPVRARPVVSHHDRTD